MNKKIYYKNKVLQLGGDPQLAGIQHQEFIKADSADDHTIKNLLKDFLDENHPKNFMLSGGNQEQLFVKIRERFKYIEAAGGFIERDGAYLFIYRHNRWDLPKGKFEKGENAGECAIRECREECGISDLKISHQLPSTFHIYEHKGGYALKQTFWFYMTSTFKGELRPQLEEDITRVEWFGKSEILSTVMANTYYTIADTVQAGLPG